MNETYTQGKWTYEPEYSEVVCDDIRIASIWISKEDGLLIAAAPELLEIVKDISPLLDELILRLPTGSNRNDVCDFNIKVKSILSALDNQVKSTT